MRFAGVLFALAACYTGAPANRDVQLSWRGRTRAEIADRWGAPAHHLVQPPVEIDVWAFDTTHFTLPDGSLAVAAQTTPTATAVDVQGSFRPGEIWHTTTEAAAIVQPTGTITSVEGAALHWGPPNDANLHWGTLLGAHVGMGRLDTTPTPLPSGGAYVGGMVSPTLGLVGTFSLATGTSDGGAAIGMAGGFAAQYWPENRFWVRAGPALLLVLDPGFTNARLAPGITTGASYAFVKVGTLAVDARLDVTAGPSTAFGTIGVGVNLN